MDDLDLVESAEEACGAESGATAGSDEPPPLVDFDDGEDILIDFVAHMEDGSNGT